MMSFIGHLVIILAIFMVGYAMGWSRAFEYSDHLDVTREFDKHE